MSLAAFIHGLRVFVKQFRCHHEDMDLDVHVAGGKVLPIRVCRHCGWTNYHPLVW